MHLAKLLRSGGNLLLLDEPTNDLDVDTLRALEEALLAFPGCAMVISHDRWFLDRVATHVLAFEGDSQVSWFEGNFEAYEEHRRALLGAAADRPHRHHLQAARAWLTTRVVRPAARASVSRALKLAPSTATRPCSVEAGSATEGVFAAEVVARLARRSRTPRRLPRGDAAARADRDARRPRALPALADDPLPARAASPVRCASTRSSSARGAR